MRWDNAHVARADLHNLHLPRRPPREGDDLGAQAAETEGVVCGFVGGDLLGGGREGVEGNAVEDGDEDLGAGEEGAEDLGLELKGYDRELFCVVPDDNLFLYFSSAFRVVWLLCFVCGGGLPTLLVGNLGFLPPPTRAT